MFIKLVTCDTISICAHTSHFPRVWRPAETLTSPWLMRLAAPLELGAAAARRRHASELKLEGHKSTNATHNWQPHRRQLASHVRQAPFTFTGSLCVCVCVCSWDNRRPHALHYSNLQTWKPVTLSQTKGQLCCVVSCFVRQLARREFERWGVFFAARQLQPLTVDRSGN